MLGQSDALHLPWVTRRVSLSGSRSLSSASCSGDGVACTWIALAIGSQSGL
jgi:hypothetical protein